MSCCGKSMIIFLSVLCLKKESGLVFFSKTSVIVISCTRMQSSLSLVLVEQMTPLTLEHLTHFTVYAGPSLYIIMITFSRIRVLHTDMTFFTTRFLLLIYKYHLLTFCIFPTVMLEIWQGCEVSYLCNA